jgi:hypothetical protein
MLDSMSFSLLGPGTDNHEEESHGGRNMREEVMSLPDTGDTSEGFSNLSSPQSGWKSPLRDDSLYRAAAGSGSGSGGGSGTGFGAGGGLGLAVEDLGMNFIPLKRADSVMSLSESEGGSDWEKVSVARSN